MFTEVVEVQRAEMIDILFIGTAHHYILVVRALRVGGTSGR